jgi:DNA-binding beta-propeller fold protein YncE
LAYHGTENVRLHRGFWGGIFSFIFGEKKEAFASPYGLCFQGEVLWVADPGSALLHRLSFATGEHRVFQSPNPYSFVTPVSVVALPNGKIWVADSTTAWISEFDSQGNWVRRIGGHKLLGRPTGMFVDASLDRVLVVDTTRNRLLAFGYEGKILDRVGERGEALGQFNYPTHVTVSRRGTILVVDSLNFRIQALTPAFEPLGSFGVVGRGPGNFASPKGIAVDSEDHVYVVDSLFENVQIFDLSGRLLLAFGSHGTGLGEFTLPTGIFIDRKDQIFLADKGNSRVQIFQFLKGEK